MNGRPILKPVECGLSDFVSMLDTTDDYRIAHGDHVQYYDAISATGEDMLVVKLESRATSPSLLQIEWQLWKLNGDITEFYSSQALSVEIQHWHIYDPLLSCEVLGRPPPLAFSEDLRCFRIGAKLFIWSDGKYQPVEPDLADPCIEDVTACGNFVAVARRRNITEKDLKFPETTLGGSGVTDMAGLVSQKLEISAQEDHRNGISPAISTPQSSSTGLSTKASTTATCTTPSNGEDSRDETQEATTEDAKSGTNVDTGITLTTPESDEDAQSVTLDESGDEWDTNSAYTSWSESSTRAASELDDDDGCDYWDDSDGPVEDLDFSDDAGSDMNVQSDHVSFNESDDEIEVKSDENGENESDNETIESTNRSIESNFAGEYSRSSDEGSDSDNEGGGLFEDLLFSRRKAKTAGEDNQIALQIFDMVDPSRKTIFHYSHQAKSNIFASPPVFHPTKSLLVWPLGGSEVLFADYARNRYFKRLLSRSTHESCQVFVKARFSADGAYLHFAALEASPVDVPDKKKSDEKTEVQLNLQVSTHRLSQRKVTRSPPQLLFRIDVPLGTTSELNVSYLPYETTWRANNLYLTTRDPQDLVLNVIRIPLFSKGPDGDAASALYTQKPVSMPQTIMNRSIRYLPPKTSETNAVEATGDQAIVLIGSNCSVVAQDQAEPKVLVSPPLTLLLHEERDLGGWHPRCNQDADKKAEKKSGKMAGRLRDMYETFHLSEEFDVAPFLR